MIVVTLSLGSSVSEARQPGSGTPCRLRVGLSNEVSAAEFLGHGVARKRRTHRFHQVCTAWAPPETGRNMMVLIGIDPHKATHTAVAVDKEETALAELTVKADRHQVERLLKWAI